MNSKLNEIVNLMPFVKEMSGKDAEINVWDCGGVIVGHFPNEKVKLPFELGFHLEDKSDPMYKVLATGKREFVSAPAEVFGEPIEGYITPIRDGKEIIGCVTYVFSAEQNKQIAIHSDQMNHLLATSNNALTEIWSTFNSVTENMKEIHEVSQKINEDLENVQSINSEIQRNAKYSNILALNASIESARVGAAGKGFAVVSDEMRKFAKISSDSADAINKTINEIVNAINQIYTTIDRTLTASGEQYANVDQAKTTLDQINVLSSEMQDLCKNF